MRLARYFGTSARYWQNLQNHYDLEIEKDRIRESVARMRPLARVGE